VWVWVLLGLTGRWTGGGVVDTMLSLIALEVTGISQHCQKGIMGCNNTLDMLCQSAEGEPVHLRT